MTLGRFEAIIRATKGILMGMLFALFFAGIVLELLWLMPAVWLMDRMRGPDPDRIPRINQSLMRTWLFLLRMAGMLRPSTFRGSPYDGPCLMVSNHPGLFDVLFFIRDIPKLSVLVKPSLARKLPLSPVFRRSGYVLAPSGRDVSPLTVLHEAVERIRNGRTFLLFPEGTRSPKGGLRPFRPGVFRIAHLAGVPVQPVLIRNIPPFLPKEDKWYFPPAPLSPFVMEFWEPMDPPEPGKEAAFVKTLERRYRKALGLSQAVTEPSLAGGVTP